MKKPTIRLLEEKKKEKRQKIDKQPFLRGAGDFEIPEMRALGDIENLATETTEDGIVLTWENVNTNEDGFLVERSLDGVNFAGIDFIESGSTTYTDLASNLDENVEYYYYRIIGIKGHNRTMPSEVQQGALLNPWALTTDSEDGTIQALYTDSEDGTPELILINLEDR